MGIAGSGRRLQPPRDTTERALVGVLERRTPHGNLVYWLVWLVLVLASLSTVFPLYWLVTGALKSSAELFRKPPALLPEYPQWRNYALAWSQLRFGHYFRNTLALAGGIWMVQLLVSALAAFSLSRLRPVGGRLIFWLFLGTLMVPPSTYLIPQYLTVVRLPVLHISLIDTWWAVWLPGAVSGFSIFVLKTFFDQIPADLIDAARIDGASNWYVFWRIVLPLARPALAIVSIFAVIGAWKDFFWPYLVLTNADLQPIMVALFRLSSGAQHPFNLIVAALVIASVPPIVLFVVFQRQILRGIMFTGIRG